MGAAVAAPYNQVDAASPLSSPSQRRARRGLEDTAPASPLCGATAGASRNLQAGLVPEGHGYRGRGSSSASEGESDEESPGIMDHAVAFMAGLGQSCTGDDRGEQLRWELKVGGSWVPFSAEISQQLTDAQAQSRRLVTVRDHRNREYLVDLLLYEQKHPRTGERNPIRCIRVGRGGGDMVNRAFEVMREILSRAHQHRSALLFLLGVVLIVVALGMLMGGGDGAPSMPGPAPPGVWPAPAAAPQTTAVPTSPPLMPAPGARWYACMSSGLCGSAQQQTWVTSPQTLAASVPADLSSLPGVAAEAWNAVAGQWRGAPPIFKGTGVTLEAIASFMKELLASDPFSTGGQDVPFVDFRPPSESKVMAVTQRQLAFVVANVLMGNTFSGGTNGLTSALQRCGTNTGKRAYIFSLLSLLAVLSRELADGGHGQMLVGAAPKGADRSWMNNLGTTLPAPTVCKRQADGSFDCGLSDFMSGGTPTQALTDIAGGVLGGGAQLCDIAASQDESLVQFYSEVLAFAFFTNGANKDDAATGMLPSPFVLLGARRYMADITGESVGGSCGTLPGGNWLNEGISTHLTSTSVAGGTVGIYSSAFVGVASVCAGCNAGSACTHEDLINNQCDVQRRNLEQDVTNWYQAFEPTMYDPSVQQAFRSVVTRIGTGPWGAGVWYGDSQQSFLTVWVATALLSGISLDYYLYPSFCENQGNQCFVLGSVEGCEVCVQHGAMPGAGVNPGSCGLRGISEVVKQFQDRPVSDLYNALIGVGRPPKQVFDLLKDL